VQLVLLQVVQPDDKVIGVLSCCEDIPKERLIMARYRAPVLLAVTAFRHFLLNHLS
jgi:hypothetical protein